MTSVNQPIKRGHFDLECYSSSSWSAGLRLRPHHNLLIRKSSNSEWQMSGKSSQVKSSQVKSNQALELRATADLFHGKFTAMTQGNSSSEIESLCGDSNNWRGSLCFTTDPFAIDNTPTIYWHVANRLRLGLAMTQFLCTKLSLPSTGRHLLRLCQSWGVPWPINAAILCRNPNQPSYFRTHGSTCVGHFPMIGGHTSSLQSLFSTGQANCFLGRRLWRRRMPESESELCGSECPWQTVSWHVGVLGSPGTDEGWTVDLNYRQTMLGMTACNDFLAQGTWQSGGTEVPGRSRWTLQIPHTLSTQNPIQAVCSDRY